MRSTVLVASPHAPTSWSPHARRPLCCSTIPAADTFTVARKDYPSLSGAYAASDLGQFAIDNNILNQSLSRNPVLDKGQGGTSGFAFAGSTASFAPPARLPEQSQVHSGPLNTPGLIERVNLTNRISPLSTRTIEAPLFPVRGPPMAQSSPGRNLFIRSLAALPNGTLVSLTQSGFTVFPLDFDATTATIINSVVNGTDKNQPLSPGGLIDILAPAWRRQPFRATPVPRPPCWEIPASPSTAE